jgi:predicted nucleic acid-binding protein
MYWDTSALLKIYIPESDSGYFLDFIARADQPVLTSVIAGVEVCCALNRKEQAGDIRRTDAEHAMKRFTKDCAEGRIHLLSCGDKMVIRARELVELARTRRRPVMIRSLDAIHVASALSIRAAGIVTTDICMRDVAGMVSLKILPGANSPRG